MDTVTATTVRWIALATALAGLAVLGALPLVLGLPPTTLASGLLLVATAVALQALLLTRAALPVSLALYTAGVVLAVHEHGTTVWSVPALAVALLVLTEASELRWRISADWAVERQALVAHARQLTLIGVIGAAAAALALAAGSLPSVGGFGAGLLGTAAVVAAFGLIRTLARSVTHGPVD